MKRYLWTAMLVWVAAGSSWGQYAGTEVWQQPMTPGQWQGAAPAGYPEMGHATAGETPVRCDQSHATGSRARSLASRWFAAQEYLLVRTHFSEALAFARVNGSFVRAEELDFDYESSFRSILGFHWNECTDVRFRYWNLNVDTRVTGAAGPGETIVDPYGAFAGAGGDIAATAAVDMNVYDLEVVRPVHVSESNLNLDYTAGVRFADVEQSSGTTIRNGGVVTSRGDFDADFFGVGPYFSLTGEMTAPRRKRFSLLAKGGAALLVGQYDVSSRLTFPGLGSGGQIADRIRTVPVAEAELGGKWNPTDYLSFSAGWLFQSWWNIGASGGTFDTEGTPLEGPAYPDTAFVGTDDSDIMSFDGLFIRGELEF